MKTLIYRDNNYYLSDDINDSLGKTNILKYKASSEEMPHQYFKDYIVVYGRPACPYCINTFELLKSEKKAFIFVEVDSQPSNLLAKSALLDILKPYIKNHSTVPIIFDKGKFIGGSSEASNYF